jgi:Glycoside hydrolase family 5 C-terminal domain
LQTRKVKALARTYAKAIQGTPVITRFNSNNGAFSMTFTFDATITEPTILFRSTEYYYPNGYNLIVFDDQGIPLSDKQLSIKPRAQFANDIEVKILDLTLHGKDL